MANIQVNPNFHTLSAKNILDRADVRFREYRAKWEEWPRNFYRGDFQLDVEDSSVCNPRCEFCETNYEKVGSKYGYMEFEVFKKVIDDIPLKRAGKPLDIARMVLFLASDAGNYITGEVFTVAGGD